MGGVVCACGYDSSLTVCHSIIDSEEDLDNLRRSKYVQSKLGDVLEKIKFQIISENKKILFVGTPCQVAACKTYLWKYVKTNILLVDLICHGVSSPEMFSANLEYIETRFKKKINRYEFRKKNSSIYDGYSFYYEWIDGTGMGGPYFKDPYFNAFYDMTSLNEICYKCPFACLNRCGDLTICDYDWAKNYHVELEKYNDISGIIVNSLMGESVVELLKNSMQLIPSDIAFLSKKQPNLYHPASRPKYRNIIYKKINKEGYNRWARHLFLFGSFKKSSFGRSLVYLKHILQKNWKGRRI